MKTITLIVGFVLLFGLAHVLGKRADEIAARKWPKEKMPNPYDE